MWCDAMRSSGEQYKTEETEETDENRMRTEYLRQRQRDRETERYEGQRDRETGADQTANERERAREKRPTFYRTPR